MPVQTRPLLAIAWALGLGLIPGPAVQAEDPCAADVLQLCPDVKSGSARLASCLRDHRAKVSIACGEKLDADALRARKFIEEFGRACRPDVEQYCASVEPGGGRVFGCLAQHQLDLSSSCQAQVTRIVEARERVTAVRKACTADAERLCQGVPPQVGPLLECLKANEARLSSGCNAAELREAVEAGTVVEVMEDMTRQDRIREVLQVLQGLDSVAFSRSQILLQFDSFEGLKNQANASRLLFNPQFVFGDRREFSFQLKVPVTTLYPYATGDQPRAGLGAVVTALGWNFHSQGQARQYLGLGLQWQTAASAPVSAPWALVPSYAVALSLARWASLTTQVVWSRSVGSNAGYAELNLLQLEPILVFALPGRSFLALDTRLGWDLTGDTLLPLVKGVAGLFVDRQKSLSITAWYQASLSTAAREGTYKYEVGLGLAYYFDW
jgi:hypothetical protein